MANDDPHLLENAVGIANLVDQLLLAGTLAYGGTGRYNHSYTENAEASQIARISRTYSINPLCCSSTQAYRKVIIST